jgi:Asp-tRNA(Asn)/Glu-tRNA(Gln) amidotransferase B subunit
LSISTAAGAAIENRLKPDMRSSAEAKAYLDTIRAILMYLDHLRLQNAGGSIRST